MNHIFLAALFLVLYSAQTLNLDLSLAPGLSAKNLFLYLAFATLAIETAVTRQRRPELLSVFGPFALFVSYAICMWIAALLILEYPGYSVRESLIALKSGPIEDLMVLLVFFYGLSDTKRALWVLRSMLWVVVAGNVIIVMDAFNMPDLGLVEEREDGRIGGTFGSSNQFAYFMAVLLPLIAALCWTEVGIKRWLAWAGLLVSAVAFLMTASRGGIVGLIAGAALGGLFLRKLVPLRLIIHTGLAVLIVSAIALTIFFSTNYGDLLVDRFGELEGSQTYASSGRTDIWTRLLHVMSESPISFVTGFGWWAYQSFLAMGHFRFVTHSVYLDVLFNLGIVGLMLFLAMVVNVLRTVRAAITVADDTSRAFLVAFLIGFTALLVAISFGNLFTPWLYIWAVAGISLRVAASQTQAGHELERAMAARMISAHPYVQPTLPAR